MSARLAGRLAVAAAGLAAPLHFAPVLAEDGPIPQGSADAGAPLGDHARPAAWRTALTAGTKDKTASLSLDVLRLASVLGNSSTQAAVSSQSLELVVSTPWDKENDASLADLDGLGDGTSLTLTYSFFGTRRTVLAEADQVGLENAAIAKCRADGGRKLDAKPDEIDKTCSLLGTDGLTLVRTYLTPRDDRAYSSKFFTSDLQSLTLTGKLEFQGFDHYDPLTLAKTKDDKTSWSANLAYTWYPRSMPAALSAGIGYERAWKGADKKLLCPAPTGSDPVECINGADAAPKLEDGFKLSANARLRFFSDGKLSKFAISPKVTYDVTNDVFGAELPIYFIPNDDGGLTGGAKIGYRSDKDDVTFGIFIGAAFGIVQ